MMLRSMGLVLRQPKRTTYVLKLTREEILERIAVRLTLKGMACLEAARRMTDDDRRELVRLQERIARAASCNLYPEFVDSHLAYHRFTWLCAGNQIPNQTLAQLTAPQLAFFGVLQQNRPVCLRDTEDPHARMTEALLSGNAAAIEKGLNAHIHVREEPLQESGLASSGEAMRKGSRA